MMKIGILTFHCAHNYGAVLQAYATQEVLISMGHNVEIINYRPKYLLRSYGYRPFIKNKHNKWFLNLFEWIKVLGIFSLRFPKKIFRRKGFNRFINGKLNLSAEIYTQPFISNFDYDLFIMGSDQIWNSSITQKLDNLFWGDFEVKEKTKKIAYAASMSNYDLKKEEESIIGKLLLNFDSISVREEQLAIFIQQFNIKASIVLDPTLLVNNSIWKKISVKPFVNKKYVLVYALGLRNETLSIAKKIAMQLDAVVIELSCAIRPMSRGNCYDTASPEEFLGWFEYASHVVTSSFHGTAFSISYQKPFYSVKRGTDHDSRQLSLLKILDLQKCFIDKDARPDAIEIDYSLVLPNLKLMQKKSFDFLISNLQ